MRKISKKGFTLIELLVVVAIIGILAAVGVVAYNGYTGNAKVAKTKADHATVVKYIASETKKCDLGETDAMSTNLTCANKTASTVITAAVTALEEFKNAYVTTAAAVTNTGDNGADTDVGYIRLNPTNATTINVKSCNKKECSLAANKQENSVQIE